MSFISKASRAQNIYGNWSTLLIPFYENESINFSVLEEEIDSIISCKVDGIYSNGVDRGKYARSIIEKKCIEYCLCRYYQCNEKI